MRINFESKPFHGDYEKYIKIKLDSDPNDDEAESDIDNDSNDEKESDIDNDSNDETESGIDSDIYNDS